jgi:putative FmdB family regulatory protein
MPFYEYQCSACGHHHEELQKITDRPMRKCPACGRASLRRLVSAPVFRLKGGGWYETDFKAEKEEKRNIAGEREPPAEKAKDEKPKDDKAEAKPAEKAAGKEPAAKPADSPAKPKAAKPKPVARRRIGRRARR